MVEGSEGQDAKSMESMGSSTKHGDMRRAGERYMERASSVFGLEDSREAKYVLNWKG
jgi:hypothetical protein